MLRNEFASESEEALIHLEKDPKQKFFYEAALSGLVTRAKDRLKECMDVMDAVLVDRYLNELSQDARCLYVRLLLRKRDWLLVGDMQRSYLEVQDFQTAKTELQRFGFIHDESCIEYEQLEMKLKRLSLSQLKDMIKTFKCSTTRPCVKKDDFIQLLLGLQAQKTLSGPSMYQLMEKKASQMLGPMVRLNDEAADIFNRLFVAYLGLTYWDEEVLKEEILVTIRKRAYPSFNMDVGPLFQDRQHLVECKHIISYYKTNVDALKLEAQMCQLISENAEDRVDEIYYTIRPKWQAFMDEYGFLAALPNDRPPFLLQYQPVWVWTRMLSVMTTVFAKQHKFESEVEVLESLLNQRLCLRTKRGKWWNRLLLVLEKLERQSKSRDLGRVANVARMALEDPYLETGARHDVEKRASRCQVVSPRQKKQKVENTKSVHPTTTIRGNRIMLENRKGKSKWVSSVTGEPVHVEEIALEHYDQLGWKGYHCENGILTTLYSLLFWDIIFLDVPGVFQNPFQVCPLDMFTEFFYEQRKEHIDKRLVDIEKEGFAVTTLQQVFQSESPSNTSCIGVSWEYPLEDLIEIIQCIGPFRLSRLCRLFSLSYKNRRGGLPDLCLWDPEKKAILFAEVKGPGDRLMANQEVWLHELSSMDFDVEVCLVQDCN